MIKVNNSKATFNGSVPELLTELTVVIRGLSESIPKQMIEKAFKLAFMTEDELNEEMTNLVNELDDFVSELRRSVEES